MPEMIITAPMPSKGTGGSGGDVAAPEIALESGPLNRATTGDDNKRVDPEATQHFCSQVIRGYKDFRNQEIKNQGRPLGEIRPTLSIVPSGAGIAHFDQWDSKFWAEKNEELKASNRNNDRENNCRVMDEVQGL